MANRYYQTTDQEEEEEEEEGEEKTEMWVPGWRRIYRE